MSAFWRGPPRRAARSLCGSADVAILKDDCLFTCPGLRELFKISVSQIQGALV